MSKMDINEKVERVKKISAENLLDIYDAYGKCLIDTDEDMCETYTVLHNEIMRRLKMQ